MTPVDEKLTRAIYKPDPKSTTEYMVCIDDVSDYNKWREGDKSIAVSRFIAPFEVFCSDQGAEGIMGAQRLAILDAAFKTTEDQAIIEIILEKGRLETSSTPFAKKFQSLNDSRSGGNSVSRGAQQSGGR